MSLEILVSIELVYVGFLIVGVLVDAFFRVTADDGGAVVTATLPTALVDICTIFALIAATMGAAFKINDAQDSIRAELVEARHDVMLQIARSKAEEEVKEELEQVERLMSHMIEKIEISDYKQKILFGTELTAGKAAGVVVSMVAGLATTASHLYRIVILHHESNSKQLHATDDVFSFH